MVKRGGIWQEAHNGHSPTGSLKSTWAPVIGSWLELSSASSAGVLVHEALPSGFLTLCSKAPFHVEMACVSTRLEFPMALLFWTASVPFSPVLLGFTPFDKSHPHLLFPREAPLYFGLRVLMMWDYLLMILRSPSKESLYVSHSDICRNLFVLLRPCRKCFWGVSKRCSTCTIELNFTLLLYVTGNTLGLSFVLRPFLILRNLLLPGKTEDDK